MGGFPFSGFGMSMSITQSWTQVLQPLQTSSLNMTGLFGVMRFGNICDLFVLHVAPPVTIVRNGLRSSFPDRRSNRGAAHPP